MNNPRARPGLGKIGALGALIIAGALIAPGEVVAAAGPALPLPTLALPTLAPPSALPIVTPPPPRPTASLPVPTASLVPIPTLPTVRLLPVSTAPVPLVSPDPTAAPTAPPGPSVPDSVRFASLPPPSASASPLAPAVVSQLSTPSPAPSSSPNVIPANGLVDARTASGTGSGLIVSEVTPERPVAVAIARSSGTAGQFVWLVPGLVLGLPGALLLVIVAAQVFGAAAFLGLTRRTLGGLGLVRRAARAR